MHCPSCGQDNPPEAGFCASCGAALATTVEAASAEVAPSPGLQPAVAEDFAGFWLRFGAFVIDGVVVWIISIILSVLTLASDTGPLALFSLILPWLYYWLFTGLKGQTPGKMAVGIKVIDAGGNVPGLGRAALRETVGKIISAIPLFLGYFWVAWDPKKQGWHDKLAGTYVTKSRR